jgi:hypothetical protein
LLVKGRVLPLSNWLQVCIAGRWLSFEVSVNIMTPVHDFIQSDYSDTVLMRPIQIKLPAFPPARIKLRFKTFIIKYFGAFGLKILSK